MNSAANAEKEKEKEKEANKLYIKESSYLQARPVLLRQCRQIELVQVGAGGNGSWLFPHVVRLARELKRQDKQVSLKLIDPDLIESKNLVRQNYAEGEVGLPKATSLAFRYGAAWGMEIEAFVQPFSLPLLENSRSGPGAYYDRLVIVIGCVDNAAARRELAGVLKLNSNYAADLPRVWLLDTGNYAEGGQVLLGSAPTTEEAAKAFSHPGVCSWLPSPYLQHPELLEALPEELSNHHLSCAELALVNAQAFSINAQVASLAADFLYRLLLVAGLKRLSTYLHLPTATMRSVYTSPQTLARWL
jgi:PRTRC genetic system ThiF family protein